MLGASFAPIARVLKPEHFSRPDHQLIFSAMLSLVAAGAERLDTVTVAGHLQRFEQLDDAGGAAYLRLLARDTPSAGNVLVYALAVRERADARAVASAIEHALEDSRGFEAWKILGTLEEQLDQVRPDLLSAKAPRPLLDWRSLESQPLPERDWIIDHWLSAGHPALLAGAPGTGKTMVSQAIASCIALRREYLGWPAKERRVLMWAAEDDAHELHRRQAAIAKWLNVPLGDFADRFTLLSYDREEVELAGLIDQRLTESPKLKELREQIGDYRADVVLLDSIARIYGGNENDRHQVAQFMSMLSRAGDPTKAAVVIIGHPGKALGSEYSGSTAWEGAVRARWFLGRALPDAKPDQDDDPEDDDGVRYLCRRKANYSDRDWRRLTFRDGVMVPDVRLEAAAAQSRIGEEYACDVVTRAVRKLAEMGETGVGSSNSPKYLPRLAREFKLLDRLSEKQFSSTMRTMRTDGRLVQKQVGTYSNRTPRQGLVIPVNGA
jgi:archaellum biogenesis ATPase FlaH